MRFKHWTVWYTLHRQHRQQVVMFCLVHNVLCRAVVSLQSCFQIYMFYWFVTNALCTGFTKIKLRQNREISRYDFFYHFNLLSYYYFVACEASVSVWFRSKERRTRVKDCAKNGARKRAGRGWKWVTVQLYNCFKAERPGARFSKVPLSLQGRVYLKPGVRKKRKTHPTPNDYEVLVIWVRRLSESSFSSVCTSFLTLITKLHSHSAWASVPDSGF